MKAELERAFNFSPAHIARLERIWTSTDEENLSSLVRELFPTDDPVWKTQTSVAWRRETRGMPASGALTRRSRRRRMDRLSARRSSTNRQVHRTFCCARSPSTTGPQVAWTRRKRRALFFQAAAQGDPLATMWVARCYHTARCGFPRDETKAQKLAGRVIDDVKKSAESGHPMAMALWASALSDGLGVGQNKEESARWSNKAAEAGDLLAMGHTASACFDRGDYSRAIDWYEQAAAAGSVWE